MDEESVDFLSYRSPPEQNAPPAQNSYQNFNRLIALPITLCGAATILWAARLPITNITFAFFGYICVMLGGLAWLFQISWRNFTVPIVIAVLIVLHAADVPNRVTFFIHKPFLDRWAKSQKGIANLPATIHIGLYELYDIDRLDAPGQPAVTIHGYLRGSQSVLWEGGLVYSPHAQPVNQSCEFYEHISGDWYFLYNDN